MKCKGAKFWGKREAQWDPFLDKYRKAIDGSKYSDHEINFAAEEILFQLLVTNCKYIDFNVTHPRFQINFRKTDVTPNTDMAIWTALKNSKIFWNLAQQENHQDHEIAYAMNNHKKGEILL